MSRVTSKLQVTIPKALATAYGIAPGSEIEFEAAGEVIRVRLTPAAPVGVRDVERRLALFDAATARQDERNDRLAGAVEQGATERGWRREDLYERGVSR
jgi:AbrB family looped-hinge helix DNA binding protein